MSSCHTEFIPCSRCGRKGDYIVWDSVNTERNRELADKVKDESLFEWTCPHCGHKEAVWYPCLYHDKGRKLMVYLVPNGEIDTFESQVTEKTAGRAKISRGKSLYFGLAEGKLVIFED